MNLRSAGLFVTALLVSVASYAQNDNSVNVTPHWKNNETHTVKIRNSVTDTKNGNALNYVSAFDAKFLVKEVSDSGYQVEWTYTNVKLADNDPVVEDQIITKLANTKLLVKLSAVGKFKELVNAAELSTAANKAVDELIAGSAANHTMNAQYKAARQMIATRQGLEVAILKQIKFYNFSFGYNYKTNFVQTNNIKFPNPMGGPAFDAVEKVQLTKLDTKNTVCTIETNKTIDGNVLKTSVIEYVKKATNSNPQALEEMNKANLEITESSMQQIDYSKSIIQKSFFKRVMNIGFQNRTTVLEIETVN